MDTVSILNKKQSCGHWVSEQVCSLTDGLCPICLQVSLTASQEKVKGLREALKTIVKHDDCGVDCDTYNCNCLTVVQEIAEQALEDK